MSGPSGTVQAVCAGVAGRRRDRIIMARMCLTRIKRKDEMTARYRYTVQHAVGLVAVIRDRFHYETRPLGHLRLGGPLTTRLFLFFSGSLEFAQ